MSLVIRGGTIVDGTGRVPFLGDITIECGQITGIERLMAGSGGQIIEASGAFVLPGLWDAHVHLQGSAGMGESLEEFTSLQLQRNLRAYLYNGVTAVVDLMGIRNVLAAWRTGERRGELLAPRVFAAGPGFTAPGGHPAASLVGRDRAMVRQAVCEVDEPMMARREVRAVVAEGADLVKAVYSNCHRTLPRLDLDVLKSIVDEAHTLGKRVVVHVDSSEEMLAALAGGADGIEHFVDAHDCSFHRAINTAVSAGASWTPTLAVHEAAAKAGDLDWLASFETHRSVAHAIIDDLRRPDSSWHSPSRFAVQHKRAFEAASSGALACFARRGGRVVAGSDAGNPGVFHGLSLHHELELLVRCGLSPLEAIASATRVAAEKVGVEAELGTLEPGKQADLVVLDKDPLDDIRNTRSIRSVIKRGVLYRRDQLAVA